MITYPGIIQGSEEWDNLRRPRATASNAKKIITAAKGLLSTSAKDYAIALAAQSFYDSDPNPPPRFIGNAHTDNGNEREPLAREAFSALTGLAVETLGFCTTDDGLFGCSPDMVISGAERGGEIKCPMLETHCGYLLAGVLPDDYRPQVHFSLAVTGWQSWDFVSFFPDLPLLHVEVRRDAYTDAVLRAMDDFRILYAEAKREMLKKFSGGKAA